MPVTLAERLKALRTERDLTLRELADRSGLSNGYISLLENGKVESPSAAVLSKLAKALDVPLSDLLRAAGVEVATASGAEVDPELVSALRRLDHGDRAQVLSYAHYLAQSRRGRRRSR